MNFGAMTSDTALENEKATFGIAVIGGAWSFTRQTCRSVELELGVGCAQANSLAQLAESRDRLDDLRLVIVDQRLSDHLLERTDSYRRLNPKAAISLGYRDVDIARNFLHRYSNSLHGQIGFIQLNASLEVLMSSLRMLLHKEFFVPRCLLDAPDGLALAEQEAQTDADEVRRELGAKLASLTPREKQVLHLVSNGNSNKLIAKKLGITEHTVKLHVHNLSGKFGVCNRTEAARLYFAARSYGSDHAR